MFGQRKLKNGISRHSAEARRGAATVELAISLPLVFLVVFASIESCNVIFLKQALTIAAYEGALEAIKPDAKQSDVLQQIQMVLDARNIQATSISAGDANGPVEQVAPGELITVSVTAETYANLISPKLFANSANIEAEVMARKQ